MSPDLYINNFYQHHVSVWFAEESTAKYWHIHSWDCRTSFLRAGWHLHSLFTKAKCELISQNPHILAESIMNFRRKTLSSSKQNWLATERENFESYRFQERHVKRTCTFGLDRTWSRPGKMQREFWQKRQLCYVAESRNYSPDSPHHVLPKETEKEFYSWSVLCHPTLCPISWRIKEANGKTQPQIAHLMPLLASIRIVGTTPTRI